MGVDGGSGNTISFQDLQTYYGGTNPISISEYNRGGSLVPDTTTQNGTVTASGGKENLNTESPSNFPNNHQTLTISQRTAFDITIEFRFSGTNLEWDDAWTYFAGGGVADLNSGQALAVHWYRKTGAVTSESVITQNFDADGNTGVANAGLRNVNPATTALSTVYDSGSPFFNGARTLSKGSGSGNPSVEMRLSGTTGSDGATYAIWHGWRVNDNFAGYAAPNDTSGYTITATETIDANTNIPTTFGAGNEGNSASLDSYNAPGTPAP